MKTVVVYVHGLWLRGHEATLLRRRLAQALEATVLSFTYPSVAGSATANAGALARHLAKIPADTLHLVAHSLGGLVILRMFEEFGMGGGSGDMTLPPGRIVFMGSPVQGSHVRDL